MGTIEEYSQNSQVKRLPLERNIKPPQALHLPYTPQTDEDDEGGLNLGQVLGAVRRRAIVIVGMTAAVAAAALAQTLSSTPTYEGKFELLTQPVTAENKVFQGLNDNSKNQQDNSSSGSGVDDTKLRVLQSPQLMSPILKQLQVRYPNSDSTDLQHLKIELVDKTNVLSVSYQDPDQKKVELVLDLVSKAYLKYSLDERQADVRQAMQFVEEQLPKLQERVATLQQQLQTFRQQHDIIDPTNQGQQLSTQIGQIEQQRLDAQTQLAKMQALYTALQKQLQLQPNEAVAASALSEDTRYQKLLDQLQEIEAKIAVESARFSDENPTLQSLRAQRQNLLPLVQQEAQRVVGNKLSSNANERGLAAPNSLRTQQIQQIFDAAKQIQALEAQNQALTQAERSLRQQVKEFPAITRQNDDLERQLKIATENLNQFLTKREALLIDAAQKQVPWKLLTPPTQPEASTANVKNNLILGTVLGFLLGIGAALVLDKFTNLFYTPEDVKDVTRLPLLGEIPFKEEVKQLVMAGAVNGLMQSVGSNFKLGKRGRPSQQQNLFQFWESLSSLYTNIRFTSFDAPIRSLAIISASPEEGRSTIAVHLAQTASAMGQRVLLVDADLRNPKLHTMLGLPNIRGLSNIIVEHMDFKDVIQPARLISMQGQNYGSWETAPKQAGELTTFQDNFFILTAGQLPPNPTNLLSSQKMQNLAAQFQTAFDLVIYDTTPLLGLADTTLLAAHTDATLLVVGLGKTNRSALEKALERLKLSSTLVLGVVVNGVKGSTTSFRPLPDIVEKYDEQHPVPTQGLPTEQSSRHFR